VPGRVNETFFNAEKIGTYYGQCSELCGAKHAFTNPAAHELETAWDREWETNLMEAAIEKVKKKVRAEDYQVFDLYVFKEWPVSRVARTLHINPGKVYLIKHRVGNLIKKEVNRLREKPF